MPTALYRLNGSEVIYIAVNNRPFSEVDSDFFGVLVDPGLADGDQTREITEGPNGVPILGPKRQLGFAKFADVGANIVRNATQAEIDAWHAAAQADSQAQDARDARQVLQNHPVLARTIAALIRMILANEERANKRYNTLANQWNAFVVAMQGAATIAAIRTGMQSITPPAGDLPEDYNLAQILQNLFEDIRPGDGPSRFE